MYKLSASSRNPKFVACQHAESRSQPIALPHTNVLISSLIGVNHCPHYDREDRMSRKRTPDQKSTETTTPVAEAPAPETKADGQSFADRVGQKKWVTAPDPFGIAKDKLADVHLFES